jgi:hypothetical protein
MDSNTHAHSILKHSLTTVLNITSEQFSGGIMIKYVPANQLKENGTHLIPTHRR